jgi:hypothetical protein
MSDLTSRQISTYWAFGGIFLFLAFLLIGFHLWIRFFVLSEQQNQITLEKTSVESLKVQQTGILKPELKELFQQYSDGIGAIETVFAARDEVFTGQMDEEDFQPVVILDYPRFFELLQKLLGNKSYANNFNISATGQLSFLVQTTSYLNAGRQMAALQFGLSEEVQQKKLASKENEDEDDSADAEDEEKVLEEDLPPPLLIGVQINSVTRNEVTGEQKDIPDLLKDSEATYDFIVVAQINPEYYVYELEQRQIAEETKEEEEEETKTKDDEAVEDEGEVKNNS